MKKIPQKIITTEFCDYGCNNIANYIFSNGKKCCTTTGGNCPAIRKIATEKRKNKLNKIDENGLNGWQKLSRKIALLKYNDIDENGLNGHQRSALLAADTVKNKIMPDGRSLKEHMVENAHKTIDNKIMTDGKTLREHLKINQSKIMTMIREDGLSEAQRRTAIANKTKANDIDENGLNGFDRAATKFPGTSHFMGSKKFYIQSGHESNFLSSIMLKHNWSIEELELNVKRGPTIHYIFENKKRWYVSDFIIGNTIYEIKSDYTWFVDESRNKMKLNTAISMGFDVVLVLDGVELSYPIQCPIMSKRPKKP